MFIKLRNFIWIKDLAKNEHLCANVRNDIIVNYVFHGVVIELKEKKAQLVFVSISIYGQTFDGLWKYEQLVSLSWCQGFFEISFI